jgi:hypothetical protein
VTNESQRLVGQFHKNSEEIVKVNLCKWKGRDFVDVRIWHLENPRETGAEIATKKGLCLSVDLVPDLIAGLQAAIDSTSAENGAQRPDA